MLFCSVVFLESWEDHELYLKNVSRIVEIYSICNFKLLLKCTSKYADIYKYLDNLCLLLDVNVLFIELYTYHMAVLHISWSSGLGQVIWTAFMVLFWTLQNVVTLYFHCMERCRAYKHIGLKLHRCHNPLIHDLVTLKSVQVLQHLIKKNVFAH